MWTSALCEFIVSSVSFLFSGLRCLVEALNFSYPHPYIVSNNRCLLFLTGKAMAPPSSTLAWKIPWTEEPGGLQSMGSRKVGHDWATSLSHFTFTHWRRKWQPTPVFLPGESQGRGSLVGCHLWGRTESDTTEATQQQQQQQQGVLTGSKNCLLLISFVKVPTGCKY